MSAEPPITPLPPSLTLPGAAPTVIVVGGSFDPPHRGHVDLPVAARAAAGLPHAWLLYVPAAQSPHKGAPGAGEADRLAMLRLAIDGVERAAIWTDELDRAAWQRERGEAEPSYTADTLARLSRITRAGTRVRLLMGADQAARLHTWRQPRDILRMAAPLVLPRAPIVDRPGLAHVLNQTRAWSTSEAESIASTLVSASVVGEVNVSSSALRGGLARGDTVCHAHLHPPVARFIASRALYSAHAPAPGPTQAARE